MGACLHGAALYSCARRHRHGLEEGVNDGTGTGANPAKENPLSRAPFIGGNETGTATFTASRASSLIGVDS